MPSLLIPVSRLLLLLGLVAQEVSQLRHHLDAVAVEQVALVLFELSGLGH